MHLQIRHTWDGTPLPTEAEASVRLTPTGEGLVVEADAPFLHDPAPPGKPGPTERLWEYEVVELFLLGDGNRYLEVELNPHGHHLVLELQGVRNVIRSGIPIDFTARIDSEAGRWSGRALLPRASLPPRLRAANAYTIHGTGAARRYAAAFPVPGKAPDFHRLDAFGPCSLTWPSSLEPSP